jgi:small subunit ribosomal protein S12
MTIQQKLKTAFRASPIRRNHCLDLRKSPQKRGTCLKVFIMTPRKPNSAKRKVSRVLLSNYRRVHSYIPGITHNLQKHSSVLVRGGRVPDLPGMKYTNIRGKYDFRPLANRRNARSRYGGRTSFVRMTHIYVKKYLW